LRPEGGGTERSKGSPGAQSIEQPNFLGPALRNGEIGVQHFGKKKET
jgi:hypothetical protein